MIIQELRNETWQFIEFINGNYGFASDALEKAKQIYVNTLSELGYSENYIEENCQRIEQLMRHKADSVQAPLIHLQERAVDVWLIETLKKRLHSFLIEEKNMDIPSALYIVSQYVSLDGRDMIHKYANSKNQIA